VHTGDFTNQGTLEEVKYFDDFLATLPHKHKIIVCGNHEVGISHLTWDKIKTLLPHATCYLQDWGETVEGINFYGSPITGIGMGFHVDHDSIAMKEYFDRMPYGTNILLTHSPPFNILDLAWVQANNKDMCPHCFRVHPSYQHWGSSTLLQRIQQVKPQVHIFGHVHDHAPNCVKMVHSPTQDTVFINAAQDLAPKPIVFDVYL